jgi:hypothetical protein
MKMGEKWGKNGFTDGRILNKKGEKMGSQMIEFWKKRRQKKKLVGRE